MKGDECGRCCGGDRRLKVFFFSLLLLFGSKTADAGTEVNVYRE